MGSSFSNQVERLTKAGFPAPMFGISETLLKEQRRRKPVEEREETERRKWAVIPYIHGVSHKLKKVAARVGVNVVFSAPNKLSGLCRRVNAEKTSTRLCSKKHGQRFDECSSGVVYDIPLSCGKSYTGQTGRCLNDRLREHACNQKTGKGSNLALHCTKCGCTPRLEQTRVLRRYQEQRTREIYEAHIIHSRNDNSVSMASIDLHKKEHDYLSH